MQQRLPSLLDYPIAFAHRGGRAHAPENTIEAFKTGLRLGATGLESDVWVTVDGVPILEHDGVIRDGLRKRRIAELRRAQLPSSVPTLAEMLDACRDSEFHLSLDLKDPRAGDRVLAVVREVAPAQLPRLWLCMPNWRELEPLRQSAGPAKLVESSRPDRFGETPEEHAMTLYRHGIDAINMRHTEWNGGLVALFHRFGIYTIAWDLQHDYLLRPIFRMGIDGVHSDHVDRMMDAYQAELGAPRP